MKLQIYLLIGFTLFLNLFDGQSQKTSLLSDQTLAISVKKANQKLEEDNASNEIFKTDKVANPNNILKNSTVKIDTALLKQAHYPCYLGSIQEETGFPKFVKDHIEAIPLILVYPNKDNESWCKEVALDTILLRDLNGTIRMWHQKDTTLEQLQSTTQEQINSMLKTIGNKKDICYVYFMNHAYREFVIGYSENDCDKFINRNLQQFDSLEELLCSRYKSIRNYKEQYEINRRLDIYDKNDKLYRARKIIPKSSEIKDISLHAMYNIDIWGVNVTDRPTSPKSTTHLHVRYFYKNHIIFHDMARDETKVGDLDEMTDYYFFTR